MTNKGRSRRGRARSTYLTPGVYVEEVSSGSRPIEAVGTAVAAFVGLAPLNAKRAGITVLAVALVVWAIGARRAAW
jgi:phage tail sheath protein FI